MQARNKTAILGGTGLSWREKGIGGRGTEMKVKTLSAILSAHEKGEQPLTEVFRSGG